MKLEKKQGAFKTIREVADHLNVEQHVLRFWETKFTQIKPMKRGGGRRYYRPEDVLVLEKIHNLLYNEGYTIKGAQNVMKGTTRKKIAEASNTNTASKSVAQGMTEKQKSLLKATLGTLKNMRKSLDRVS
jgi:DNA-binding transcriptional MerR regulator